MAKKPQTFILNDESVNRYGFRVLTNGILLHQFKRNPVMYFMHVRNASNPTGKEVIGRWENIRIKGVQLLADAVFDENCEFAKRIADKVQGGFLRMASIYAERKEISTDAADLVEGQTRATVTKCVLIEASIVDQGGNDNALKLFAENGEELDLIELNLKQNKKMSYKSIAIALGLDEKASEVEIVGAISTLKAGKEAADVKLAAIEKEAKKAKKDQAIQLVGKAIKEKKIDEGMKDTYIELFNKDFDNTKKVILGMLAEKPGTNSKEVSDYMKDVGGNTNNKSSNVKLSFEELSKNDPVELARIEKEEPELFAKLVSEY